MVSRKIFVRRCGIILKREFRDAVASSKGVVANGHNVVVDLNISGQLAVVECSRTDRRECLAETEGSDRGVLKRRVTKIVDLVSDTEINKIRTVVECVRAYNVHTAKFD